MIRFTTLMLALVAVMIPRCACAQMAYYPINLDRIADPDVRTAVETINKKQAEIKEIVIEDQKMSFMLVGKLQNSVETKIYRRAPNLMLKQMKAQNGTVVGELFDGKSYWELNFAPPSQAKKVEADMKAKKASQAEIDKAVAASKATYNKADLEKLKTAGVLDEFFFLTQFAACPFTVADPDTLSLIADTPTEWVFTGKTRKNARVQEGWSMEFLVEKKNCQCMGLKMTAATGNQQVIVVNDKMSVNPAKKIEDKAFQYQPPAGVTFTDITEKTLAEFKPKK